MDTFRKTMGYPNVLGMILAGGEGSRLHPLTKERAKPAVACPVCVADPTHRSVSASAPGVLIPQRTGLRLPQTAEGDTNTERHIGADFFDHRSPVDERLHLGRQIQMGNHRHQQPHSRRCFIMTGPRCTGCAVSTPNTFRLRCPSTTVSPTILTSWIMSGSAIPMPPPGWPRNCSE